MMRCFSLPALALAVAAAPLSAQATGAIAGTVRDAATGRAVAGALVAIGDGRRGAVTDTAGLYRVREVRSGWYRVRATQIGYRPGAVDSVLVQSGLTVTVDFALQPVAVEVDPLVVRAEVDPVLDPLATATEQKVTAEDLRALPVSTLQEAIALSAGAVGESYRGGRLGQESFIIDGLGVKNQLDASTGGLGVRLPPDLLTEASLVTNGFSARYGQALSGMINVVTKDGGDRWSGRLAYETDRPLGDGADLGLDRFVAAADGPVIGPVTALAVVDATGRLDADPVNAPAPTDPRDPRSAQPVMLPHNSGEALDLAAKLTVPLGRQTVRLFGLRSVEQRLLFDPAYKYDPALAPGRRITGTLLSAHVQHASGPAARLPLVADLRVGWFSREFVRGAVEEPADYRFGAFTGERMRIVGEDLARSQDTLAAAGAVSGLTPPEPSERTPWGVPAFFQGGGPRGEIAWNRFRELRSQLDVTLGGGPNVDLYAGGEWIAQRVETFQRVLGYLPVGGEVPPPTASDFTPRIGSAYLESQIRLADLALTAGVRYDRFDPGADLGDEPLRARQRVSPRFAVSTVLAGATFVASYGQFSQAPDLQYLVDAAFDDTTRTGRFRRGNPNLGFEKASQFEFSLRVRPRPHVSLRLGAYAKRMEGLVATVPLGIDPDSTIFGNADFGNVRGAELLLDRELSGGWGARVAYTLQTATATSTSAFLLLRLPQIDPISGDTAFPASVDFPLDFDQRHTLTAVFRSRLGDSAGPGALGVRPLAGLESAAIFRYASGLPYSRTNAAGDSLIGPPNDNRLPSVFTLDVLLRRPLRLGGLDGSLYLDVRNLLGRRNILAVRRDTGTPELDEASILALAQQALAAHPEPIPFESPRYRRFADLNNDGLLAGPSELLPLYEAAARDFTQPLFAYGPPRLFRLGLEVRF